MSAGMRRCRVCRASLPASKMVRWTIQDGQLTPDTGKKAPGRGYYSCSDNCAAILPKTIKNLLRKHETHA